MKHKTMFGIISASFVFVALVININGEYLISNNIMLWAILTYLWGTIE